MICRPIANGSDAPVCGRTLALFAAFVPAMISIGTSITSTRTHRAVEDAGALDGSSP